MKTDYDTADGANVKKHALRLQEIARLRMIVGYLGEKGQHEWWSSAFCSAAASAFLDPVFGKTTILAQYHGVCEAARRVHDEHIGVGRVFHLFRLPESFEQQLFGLLRDSAAMILPRSDIESPEKASAALRTVGREPSSLQEGPVRIGVAAELEGDRWLVHAARCYDAAFRAGLRSFPYLLGGA